MLRRVMGFVFRRLHNRRCDCMAFRYCRMACGRVGIAKIVTTQCSCRLLSMIPRRVFFTCNFLPARAPFYYTKSTTLVLILEEFYKSLYMVTGRSYSSSDHVISSRYVSGYLGNGSHPGCGFVHKYRIVTVPPVWLSSAIGSE